MNPSNPPPGAGDDDITVKVSNDAPALPSVIETSLIESVGGLSLSAIVTVAVAGEPRS